ncbi:HAD family phosphatase [Bacillus sp. DNRA2]|uniref:Cof-type HAD-IIB family hydrolase n=1 Tax=Bacillus sp. DNRA2 TaxID=2723053 RepID=UPI00145CEDD5|nr:Cof-type HAD-IIB family hydrolase [Bacillus sp. DNRA2]NMD72028.1 HAD family phosphatase [Bacillus sp. DNRA2]
MIYRLLALNIDGTLLQSNGKLHRSTKDAIGYVLDKGIYVTLVTSRSFPSASKVAKALKIPSMLVTHRGAYIGNTVDKQLQVKRISEDVTYDLVRLLEGFECQIRVQHERFSLINKTKTNHNLLAKTVFSSGEPVLYAHQFVDSISESLAKQRIAPPKIEVKFEHPEDLKDATEAISRMFTEIEMFVAGPLGLEFVPTGASKVNGLIYLGECLGISRKEMVVIGADIDDIPMIEAAGLGVAMGNAPVAVKQAADWITRSQNEQGVAYMVKEHFRKQHPISFLRKMNIIK